MRAVIARLGVWLLAGFAAVVWPAVAQADCVKGDQATSKSWCRHGDQTYPMGPTGSFKDSCERCQADARWLYCECKFRAQSGPLSMDTSRWTKIEYADCPLHEIENRFGNLTCVATAPKNWRRNRGY